MIELNNITKNFILPSETVQAIKKVDVHIPENTFSIIYGPSGSGKSTLLNTLVGLEPPSTGTVTIQNTELYSMNADQRANFRARLIGMVYQTNYWVASLNVLENVAMPLYLAGYSKREADSKAYETLDKIEMQSFAKKQLAVLSGGQQQRISIARALVSDPAIIVADEPTGNLDIKNGDMIMNMLYELRHRLGKTIIMVTHNLGYIPLCDLCFRMQDGIAIQEDSKDAISISARERMLKDFRSSIMADGQLKRASAERNNKSRHIAMNVATKSGTGKVDSVQKGKQK